MADGTERSRRVILDLPERLAAGDDTAFGDLVSADFINHAAGPQGRDGFRATLNTLRHDLGRSTFGNHHLLADGDLVALHQTLRGKHLASTMPLLAGVPVQTADVE